MQEDVKATGQRMKYTGDTVLTSIRLPKTMKRDIDTISAIEDNSLNKTYLVLITEALEMRSKRGS